MTQTLEYRGGEQQLPAGKTHRLQHRVRPKLTVSKVEFEIVSSYWPTVVVEVVELEIVSPDWPIVVVSQVEFEVVALEPSE